MKKKLKKLAKNKKIIIISILSILILLIAIIIVVKYNRHDIKKESDLYGTYAYIKTITNENQVDMNIIVKIIFKKDKTAIFEASNGYASEMTKGTYKYKDGIVTYTKKNYYKPYASDNEEQYLDENNKNVTFEIYHGNKLKQKEKYYNQTIIMERIK